MHSYSGMDGYNYGYNDRYSEMHSYSEMDGYNDKQMHSYSGMDGYNYGYNDGYNYGYNTYGRFPPLYLP